MIASDRTKRTNTRHQWKKKRSSPANKILLHAFIIEHKGSDSFILEVLIRFFGFFQFCVQFKTGTPKPENPHKYWGLKKRHHWRPNLWGSDSNGVFIDLPQE